MRFPKSRWIIAATLLHLAALMPVFVTERYRMAAVPGLLLLGSACLVSAWRQVAARQFAEPLAYGAGVAAAAVFVAWPLKDPSLWSLDYHNVGIKATKAGDLARAQENLEKALVYVPDNAETLFGLGNLWLEKGDATRAKDFYRRTVEENPGHDGAWNNLGYLALEEGYLEFAEICFRRSLDAEPDDAKTHYLLAKTLKARGVPREALAAATEAMRIQPGVAAFEALQAELRAQ